MVEPLRCDFRELYGLPPNTLVLGFEVDQSEQYYVPRDVMVALVQNGAMVNRRKGMS